MKVKRYTAATMQEAIDQIRHDLGPNAVILHSRKVGRGGVMNLLGKPVIEVTAAVDEAPPGAEEATPAPPEVRASLGACVCGAVIPTGAKYCSRCGMPAEAGAADLKKTIAPPRKCPHCGTEVPLGADFCPECGGHADQEVYEV